MLSTVTSDLDSGTGTLRAAITSAGIGEVIDFDPILLNGATIDLATELLITKSLTIDASSLSLGIIIDAGNGTDDDFATGDGIRIFKIDDSNSGTDLNVTLKGLTLTGGDVSDKGGAILNMENLAIQDSIISGNAVVADIDDLVLDRVELRGGAIYSIGPLLEIENTSVENNVARGKFNGLFEEDRGHITVDIKGGGIYSKATTLDIIESVISGNSAITDFSSSYLENGAYSVIYGGGIYASTQQMSLANSQISDNRALNNMPGLIVSVNAQGTALDSKLYGGGLSVRGDGSLEITDSTISGNSAVAEMSGSFAPAYEAFPRARGGGVHSTVKMTVTGTTISQNKTEVDLAPYRGLFFQTASSGGAIFMADQLLNIHSSTISGNVAATYVVNTNDPVLLLSSASSYGGGIAVYGDNTPYISHSTIANNVIDYNVGIDAGTTDVGGAGLFSMYEATFDLDHVIAANNFVRQITLDASGEPDSVFSSIEDNVDDEGSPFSNINYSLIKGQSFTGTGNLTDDPELGPLAANGGTTKTHALGCNSPAIDAGDPVFTPTNVPVIDLVPLDYDQRGPNRNRVVDIATINNGGMIDIGAFEVQNITVENADFDGDLDVDGADFLIWQENFGTGTTQMKGDADGDGDVDSLDLAVWSEQYNGSPPLAADFDGDLDVDGDDLVIWEQSYGVNAMGDADGDADTDGADFLIWQIQFGQGADCHDWVHSVGLLDSLVPGEILVSTLRDENDGNYSLGDLSLREALVIAESTTGADVITFAGNLSGQILLTEGELNVDSDVEIVGPGAELLTIDAGGLSRVFNITASGDAVISGLTIQNGAAEDGGGIFVSGTLNLTNSVVQNNHATGNGSTFSGYGGAIAVADGTLQLAQTSILNNDANYYGGGIGVDFSGAISIDIQSSTIAYNEAVYVGGFASFNTPSVDISNSTISTNTATTGSGGGIYYSGNSNSATFTNLTVTKNDGGTYGGAGIELATSNAIMLHNSIVADNIGGDGDLIGYFGATSSYNLLGLGGTGGLTNPANNNIVLTGGQTAGLESLADNGGGVQTHALMPTSLAIDEGDVTQAASAGLTVDQRGANRHFYDPNTLSDGVDIGAYELGLVVNVSNDENDVTFDRTDLSLREALAAASANFAIVGIANRIEFNPSLISPLAVTLGELSIDSDVNIVGPGASQLTIDATGGSSRVFMITSTATVAMSGLTITGGSVIGHGGGIHNAGDLTLNQIVVVDNLASSHGGGLYSAPGSSVQIDQSSFEGNFANWSGGGVLMYTAGGGDSLITNSTFANNTGNYGGGLLVTGGTDAALVQIINSTFSGNTANFSGGAIRGQNSARVELINSTVTNNTAVAGTGGGLSSSAADSFLVHNSIVAGNIGTADPTKSDADGVFHVDSSYNLVGNANVGNPLLDTNNQNIVIGSTDPGLAPLANNGGPTKTHALLAGSLAIDAGNDSRALALGLLADQRGGARFEDGDNDGFTRVDIGALEIAFAEL